MARSSEEILEDSLIKFIEKKKEEIYLFEQMLEKLEHDRLTKENEEQAAWLKNRFDDIYKKQD